MEEKSPAFQWYPKNYLGDDAVLAMDWDARGMHVHLLNLAWQQDPTGSIPDDLPLLRRWLGLPSGFADADRVWARVWPQIMTAWVHREGRWFNRGLEKAWARQQTYKQNGSNGLAKRWQKPSKGLAKVEQHYIDIDTDSSSVDGSEEFKRFCISFGAKADRSTYCAESFRLAVGQVQKEQKLNLGESCLYLRQKAHAYWKANGKYGEKMRAWLEGSMWNNPIQENVDGQSLSKAEQRQAANLRALAEAKSRLDTRTVDDSGGSVR